MNALQGMKRYRKEVIQVNSRKHDIKVQYLFDKWIFTKHTEKICKTYFFFSQTENAISISNYRPCNENFVRISHNNSNYHFLFNLIFVSLKLIVTKMQRHKKWDSLKSSDYYWPVALWHVTRPV